MRSRLKSTLEITLAVAWLAVSACVREDTGQTGSPGPVECANEAEANVCAEGAEALAAALRVPAESVRRFVGASCERVSVQSDLGSASGPACVCRVDAVGAITVGPSGAGCFAYGRAGECLFADEEFAGCSLAHESAECRSTCDELERRFVEDAARVHDAVVLLGECRETRCRSVIRVDDKCYVDGSFIGGSSFGRPYDCALGVEAILAAYDAERASPAQPDAGELPWTPPSRYLPETLGFVEVGVANETHGAYERAEVAFASAQFFEVEATADGGGGEVLDRLEGLDDCTVSRMSGGSAPGGAAPRFFHVEGAALHDGDVTLPIVPTSANNEYFSSYAADLSGRAPRFGESYEVTVRDARFGEPLVASIVLPEALTVSSLRGVQRIEKADFPLRWTGQGQEPLWIYLSITDKLSDFPSSYRIDCLVRDDGEYTVPGEVLEGAPSGFLSAAFTRSQRAVQGRAGAKLLTLGTVRSTHHLLLGEACQRDEVVAACQRYAAHEASVYASCGTAAPAPLEVLCPDYLASACGGCSEYYDCHIEQLHCSDGGPTSAAVCACR